MMKDLHSVEEVIMTAYEYLDVMSRERCERGLGTNRSVDDKASAEAAIKLIKQGGAVQRRHTTHATCNIQ
jgi:hypothetical protein